MGPAALLAFGLLLVVAHSPALRSPLLASDYAFLLGSAGGGPAKLWSGASSAIAGVPRAGESALGARLQGVAALVVLAFAASRFLARLLAPRLGPAPARSAGLALLVLLPLHPSAVAAAAALPAREELAGVVLAALAAALFLRGRQEEHDGASAAGLATLALASWAAPAALFVVPLVAAAELVAVRRHRPRRQRLRTSATTLALALAAAGVPRLLVGSSEAVGPIARARLLAAFTELGKIALPSGEGAGVIALVFAVALLLAAWQPMLRAARNAPRLWSALFVGWGAALALALARASAPGDGRGLLALAVWTAGIATALTARSGGAPRVAAVALGWAVLANAGHRDLPRAAAAQAELARQAGARVPASAAHVLVLGATRAGGVALARDFGWMLHPAALGRDDAAVDAFDPRRVRLLAPEAFPYLAMGASFAALRERELAVLVRARDLGGEDGFHATTLVPRASAAPALPPWGATLVYAPPEPLDTTRVELVRVVAELSIPAGHLERLSWSARDAPAPGRRWVEGRLAERGGRRVAEYDLARSLPWLLAGRVRELHVEKGVRAPERGELVERMGGLEAAGAPVPDGDDWVFAAPGAPPADAAARLALTLLALPDLEHLELPVEVERGGLRARGAQRFARAHAGSVEWTLEYRSGPHAVARARGTAPRP